MQKGGLEQLKTHLDRLEGVMKGVNTSVYPGGWRSKQPLQHYCLYKHPCEALDLHQTLFCINQYDSCNVFLHVSRYSRIQRILCNNKKNIQYKLLLVLYLLVCKLYRYFVSCYIKLSININIKDTISYKTCTMHIMAGCNLAFMELQQRRDGVIRTCFKHNIRVYTSSSPSSSSLASSPSSHEYHCHIKTVIIIIAIVVIIPTPLHHHHH